MRGASGSNLLAGVWGAASPWALEYPAGAVLNNSVARGSLIAALALVRVADAHRASWLSWLNVLAGAWLTLSAFLVAGSGIALWNSFVLGITVTGLVCWSAQLSDRHRS
jgi:SPW repeat